MQMINKEQEMNNKNEQDNIISKSTRIYEPSRIVRCTIGDNCCIGQDCDLVNVIMESDTELGRRNLIRDSIIQTGTYTGTNTIIKNADIGKYSCISWNVSIGGGNHPFSNVSLYTDYWFERTLGIEIEEKTSDAQRTQIGNDVWIAAGANIINGVKIGDGAVIAAGAVVTKDVEPYSIVTGIPAREHKKRFSSEVIDILLRIKWWDWPKEKIVDNISILRSQPNVKELEKYL